MMLTPLTAVTATGRKLLGRMGRALEKKVALAFAPLVGFTEMLPCSLLAAANL